MTPFEVGDLVTVEFPYSDLRGRKRRPGLVLSTDQEDVLLARVTTRTPRCEGDVPIVEWSFCGLPKPSTIRLAKLATVDARLVLRRIGRLGSHDGNAVLMALSKWLHALESSLAGRKS
jgi:mRNA interferase MazF